MKWIVTILCMVCSWLSAYSQINKPELSRPVTSVVSSVNNKVKEVKDSVIKSVKNGLHNPPVVPQAGKVLQNHDTLAPSGAGVVADSTSPSLPDDEPITYFLQHVDCKVVIKIPIYAYEYVPVMREPMAIVEPAKPKKVPFLQVHGNILYNVNYSTNQQLNYLY